MTRRPLDVEHFRARVLQDALNEAMCSYWLRRARDFEEAMSRPEDFIGRPVTEVPDVDWAKGWPCEGPSTNYWFHHGRPVAAEQLPTRRTRPPPAPEQRAARDARLAATALACRHRAAISLLQTDVDPAVVAVLPGTETGETSAPPGPARPKPVGEMRLSPDGREAVEVRWDTDDDGSPAGMTETRLVRVPKVDADGTHLTDVYVSADPDDWGTA